VKKHLEKQTVRERLQKHLANPDSTLNDSTVDELYREAHGIRDDEETDLETVEQWAFAQAR